MTTSRPPTAISGRPGNFRGRAAISPPPPEIAGWKPLRAHARYAHARVKNRSVAAISQRWEDRVVGRGVAIELRGADGKARKVGAKREAQQIRDTARERWAAAPSGLRRWAVAFDYARAGAAAAGRGGLDTSGEMERATRLLWSLGDAFTAWLAGSEGDDE